LLSRPGSPLHVLKRDTAEAFNTSNHSDMNNLLNFIPFIKNKKKDAEIEPPIFPDTTNLSKNDSSMIRDDGYIEDSEA
jgi:hypothetical protein